MWPNFSIYLRYLTNFATKKNGLICNDWILQKKFSPLNVIHCSTVMYLLPRAVKSCYNYVPLLMSLRSTLTRHDIAGRTSSFDALKFWAAASCSLTCQSELNVFLRQKTSLHQKKLKCHSIILRDKCENINP